MSNENHGATDTSQIKISREQILNGDIWTKEQLVQYVIKLEEIINIQGEALNDFMVFGTRHDLNPTGQFKECGCFDSITGDGWQGYIRSQDRSVRERARQALAQVEKLKEELK